MLEIVALNALQDNYIWLIHHATAAVVVDPGEAPPVLAYLLAHGLELTEIHCTHAHADHVAGVAPLLTAFPNAIVRAHATSPLAHMSAFRVASVGKIALQGMANDDVLVLAIPGHTHDHIAFYWPHLAAVFCGDTLFAGGCGRVFTATAAQLYMGLKTLAALPPETKIYCAHEYTRSNLKFAQQVEPDNLMLQQRWESVQNLLACGQPTVPSHLAEELATNPFLRCHLFNLKQSVIVNCGIEALSSAVETFKALRAWKDKF